MKETGTVTSAEGGMAKVAFAPTDACEHCAAKGFCNPEPGKMLALAVNELGAEPGDIVTIETEPGASVFAAVLVFLVPITGLIIGYLLARAYWGTEVAGAIGAISVMFIFLSILAYVDRKLLKPRRYMPKITSVTRRGVGDMAKDVVCGMDVSEDSPHKTDYDGGTYYFCCESCKVNFEKNPDEYLKDQSD